MQLYLHSRSNFESRIYIDVLSLYRHGLFEAMMLKFVLAETLKTQLALESYVFWRYGSLLMFEIINSCDENSALLTFQIEQGIRLKLI